MNYVIIIEGPDNIGKTHLAKAIQQISKLPCLYFHAIAPTTDNPNEEQKTNAYSFYNMLKNTFEGDRLIICDRSLYGEFVYSKFRDYIPTYFDDINKKLAKLKNSKFLFISLYGNMDTIIKYNIKLKKDEKLTYQKCKMMEEISDAFNKIIKNIPFGTKLFVNSNQYDSFEKRNKSIIEGIKYFISGSI